MIEQLGLSKVFWIHAIIMVLGNIFVFFAMPETRGLTMTQLNEIFGGKIAYENESKYDRNVNNPMAFYGLLYLTSFRGYA